MHRLSDVLRQLGHSKVNCHLPQIERYATRVRMVKFRLHPAQPAGEEITLIQKVATVAACACCTFALCLGPVTTLIANAATIEPSSSERILRYSIPDLFLNLMFHSFIPSDT